MLFPLTMLSVGAGSSLPPASGLSFLLPLQLSAFFLLLLAFMCLSSDPSCAADDRDKSCAVVRLGKRSYGEALVLSKQVGEHLGLATELRIGGGNGALNPKPETLNPEP